MHAGRNHQGRMQAARMMMRMPHMIKNHCIVYRSVWLLQGNGAVKREQRELVQYLPSVSIIATLVAMVRLSESNK